MENNVAIVPIQSSASSVKEMIAAKRFYNLQQLAQMPADAMRRLLREWYNEAFRQNIILMLRLIVKTGQLNSAQDRLVWRQRIEPFLIEGEYHCQHEAIEMRVDGKVVCSDLIVGQEMFIPDEWLTAIMGYFDTIEIEKLRRAERADLKDREQLIDLLTNG